MKVMRLWRICREEEVRVREGFKEDCRNNKVVVGFVCGVRVLII